MREYCAHLLELPLLVQALRLPEKLTGKTFQLSCVMSLALHLVASEQGSMRSRKGRNSSCRLGIAHLVGELLSTLLRELLEEVEDSLDLLRFPLGLRLWFDQGHPDVFPDWA